MSVTHQKPRRWHWQRRLIHPKAWGIAGHLGLLLPFWEGAGKVRDLVSGLEFTKNGNPTWGIDGDLGGVVQQMDSSATEEFWSIDEDLWTRAPTTEVTVLLLQRRRDAVNRRSAAFGFQGSPPDSNTERLGAHVPWEDGTVYWDFGDWQVNGRMSVAGLSFGDDVWVFVSNGTNHMAIWQNGIRRATSASADTRTTGLLNTFELFGANGTGTNIGNNVNGALFAVFNKRLSDAQIVQLSADPFMILRPYDGFLGSRPYFEVPAVGGPDLAPEAAIMAL